MPQMAPLNWLSLFIFFVLTFILFNTMNYYSFLYEPKKKSPKKFNISLKWKW